MITNRDKAFKEAVGGFIIAFSELEYSLAVLGALTECDPRKKDAYLLEYMGYSFEKKGEIVTKYIRGSLSELQPIWDKINQEIGELNSFRRYLAHGFIQYHIPLEDGIKTHVRKQGKINSETLTTKKILEFTDRLHHVNTGVNGINGAFYEQFIKARLDSWNRLVTDENKMAHSINGTIITEWKGGKNDS